MGAVAATTFHALDDVVTARPVRPVLVVILEETLLALVTVQVGAVPVHATGAVAEVAAVPALGPLVVPRPMGQTLARALPSPVSHLFLRQITPSMVL